jgi:L-rhamnose mutarotase
MRLKPGALADYRRIHDNIWPELREEMERSGILNMTIFERAPLLFVFTETRDEETFSRLWQSEVQQRWITEMEQFLEFTERGEIDAGDLREVFRFVAGV